MLKQQIRALYTDFFKMRRYIMLGTIIFILSIVLGYYWQAFHSFLYGQIEGIATIAQELAEAENPMLQMFVFIFLNNAIKSVIIVYLGFFLGILPILFLMINGMVLGYLYLQLNVVNETITLWELIVGIMPHGIIELPVIIIACSYGMRLGALVWKKIFQLLSNKPEVEGEIKQFLQSTVRFSVFSVIALLIAAAIESVITPWLMGL